MKAVVHIGMPKTGSTVLQHTLFSVRCKLIESGFLYPDPKIPKGYNHGLLAGVAMSFEEAPREFKKLSPEEFEARTSHFVETMLCQIEEHHPSCLIISSEYLRRALLASKPKEYKNVLIEFGASEREFLMYVRRPSSFFLSACQQRLRASSKIKSLDENLNRMALDAISSYSTAFPNDRLTVGLFDRKCLSQGDIVSDFAQRYLPNHMKMLQEAAKLVPGNESLSAESMALLQMYRKAFFKDQDEVYNVPTRRFHNRLKLIDQELNYERPYLYSQISDYCDYGDGTALELRDFYGVEFPDFDYLRLERGEFASRPSICGHVNEIVNVDEQRLYQMIEILAVAKKKNTPELAYWLETLRPKKSIFSLPRKYLRSITKRQNTGD